MSLATTMAKQQVRAHTRRAVAATLPSFLVLLCSSGGGTGAGGGIFRVEAAEVKGFTNFVPRIPNNDPDLVLERVWDFGLDNKPTSIVFVPDSPQVLTVHKTGHVRLYASLDADVEDFVTLLDWRPQVWSLGDHGLTGMALHPQFAQGVKEAYLLYTGEIKDVNALPNDVSAIRPALWGQAPDGSTSFSWQDICPNLNNGEYGGGDNNNGLICEHPYYVDRFAVDLDTGTGTFLNTLVQGPCGASTTHGTGSLKFVYDDLVMSWGDGSQYLELDSGADDRDGCVDPEKGGIQGVYRSQREDFSQGKVMLLQGGRVQSGEPIDSLELTTLVRGLRNPFRWDYDATTDTLYVGDVGYGDAGTTERIFGRSNILDGGPALNAGWPCIEGVHLYTDQGVPGPVGLWDGEREREMRDFAVDSGTGVCDGVIAAAKEYQTNVPDPLADPNWAPPLYEYRVNTRGGIDPQYPLSCLNEAASITGTWTSEGAVSLPGEYQGRLFFADHTKKCVWYFDSDAEGKPITTQHPHVLIDNSGVVDMQLGPDGALYMVDYDFAYVSRIFSLTAEGNIGGQVMGGGDGGATKPPVTQDPPKPVKPDKPKPKPVQPPAVVPQAEQCPDPFSLPELEWTLAADGAFEAELTLSAAEIEYANGTLRTRVYGNSVTGPLMRMEACHAYRLRVVNGLDDWGNPTAEAADNVVKDPNVTNLHLHGLHISGLEPGDSVSVEIEPGETYTYTYIIPCDHSGGTFWYHPHHHGSTSLQASGGAAGVLIVSENLDVGEADEPEVLQSMEQAILHIHEWTPIRTLGGAMNSGDILFATELQEDFYSINGCDFAVVDVEGGKWTRLRMLFSGDTYNVLVHIDEPCELQLLAKDGVYLSEIPRAVSNNNLFFTLGSRVDIAMRCPAEGEHTISIDRIQDGEATASQVIGAVRVSVPEGDPQPDLPVWQPCRPEYLADPGAASPADSFALAIERNTINGKSFGGMDDYLVVMQPDTAQEWLIQGDELHPLHVHVNHMQLGKDVELAPQQWPQAADWHQEGDIVDVLSLPGLKTVRFLTDRFTGPVVLHCHNAAHSDTGMLAVAWVDSGDDEVNEIATLGKETGVGLPTSYSYHGGSAIRSYGTCPPPELPRSFRRGAFAQIPGVVEAEEFDRGGLGVAFSDFAYLGDTLLNYLRPGDQVEISSNELAGFEEDRGWHVGVIDKDEWLKYTVQVAEEAAGTLLQLSLRIASEFLPNGIALRIYSDIDGPCPPLKGAAKNPKLLALVQDKKAVGSGAWNLWADYKAKAKINLTPGIHTLTVCFDTDAWMMLDSFSLE